MPFWLNDYHHRVHSGIKERPVDCYNRSVTQVEIKRMSRSELDENFLVRHERVVNNDATISFKGRIYEVPAAYIRQRIEIRHPVDDNDDLFLYDNDARVGRLKRIPGKMPVCSNLIYPEQSCPLPTRGFKNEGFTVIY